MNKDFLRIKNIFEKIKLNNLKELSINKSNKTMQMRNQILNLNTVNGIVWIFV